MTAVAVSTAPAARVRVDQIKTGVEVIWSLIVESYQSRDWEALGYASWDEMCTREFGTTRLRLPLEERTETVGSLRAAGLSLRAIEAATGVSTRTIRRELSGGANATPKPSLIDYSTGEVLEDEPEPEPPVTGLDGKQYQPKASRAPYRKPLPDVSRSAGYELRKAMERIERIFDDDRYRQNAEQVAAALRGHLHYVAETVTAVLDQLP